MKRFTVFLICVFLFINAFAFPIAAVEATDTQQTVISQTVQDLGNGNYLVETIYVPTMQFYSNSKTGTKTAEYIAAGKTIYTISVTGTFTYNGTTSNATSASCAIATHVSGASILSRNAYTSGASAIASGSISYIGITLQKTVTLTCDKNGTLS